MADDVLALRGPDGGRVQESPAGAILDRANISDVRYRLFSLIRASLHTELPVDLDLALVPTGPGQTSILSTPSWNPPVEASLHSVFGSISAMLRRLPCVTLQRMGRPGRQR